MRKFKEYQVFAAAVGVALLFHGAVIYHLHELPIQWKASYGAWFSEAMSEAHALEKKQEKQEQIMKAFKPLSRPPKAHPSILSAGEKISQGLGDSLSEQLMEKGRDIASTSLAHVPLPALEPFSTSELLGEIELQVHEALEKAQKLRVGTLKEVVIEQAMSPFQALAQLAIQASRARPASALPLPREVEEEVNPEGLEGTVASSQDFTLEVDYAVDANKWVLFRLKVTPKANVVFKRIRHHVAFLIDRSSSIGFGRYTAAKTAVKEALGLLNPGDHFNVLVFDNTIQSLSSQDLPFQARYLAQAEKFLETQPHGGLFAATDLYGSLGDIIPEAVKSNEVYSAILLSDGDTTLTKEQQRQALGSWTRSNQGKVSLYAAVVGEENNLPLLNLLTVCNRGLLAYSKRVPESTKVLKELVLSMRTPIGKELVATPMMEDASQRVHLYPPPHRMPPLYLERPYVLYGVATKPSSFSLFLQGRYYDQWLDIRQKVDFQRGKKVPLEELKREIAREQAYDLYEKYLNTGNSQLLVELHALLQPHRIPVAFQ